MEAFYRGQIQLIRMKKEQEEQMNESSKTVNSNTASNCLVSSVSKSSIESVDISDDERKSLLHSTKVTTYNCVFSTE